MGTLQLDLVEAGCTATGERLVLLTLFLHKNGFYDILDLVRARDVELMPGFDDLGLVEASFVKYLWSFVNENGFVPGVVVVPVVETAARAPIADLVVAPGKRVEKMLQASAGHTSEVSDLGPRQALKRARLEELSEVDRGLWLESARVAAILGSIPRSKASFVSGLRSYTTFARMFGCMRGRELPPTVKVLLAWSELFQSAGTFGNYIGHVRLGCQLLEVSCEALTDPLVGRAKASIAKRRAFTPRKPLFLGQSRVRDILALGRLETSSQLLFHASMLFLTAYVFLLRLPSEALPIVRVGVGVSPDGKQASVSCDGDSLVLVLDRRKNRLHGSTLVRKCWCTQCSLTCPVHVLGPYFESFPLGKPVFAGISAACALSTLRTVLMMLQVPDAGLYRTHDFRRGHARDLQLGGATLGEILAAGQWSSPAFLKYLDMMQLETEAVVEAHLDESDDEPF